MKIFRDPVVAKDQVMLLPPCVSDFVAQDDPVRLAGEIIDGMDLALLAHTSLDGTKLEANVSGKQTYGRERLEKAFESAGACDVG